jgi:2-oxoglutarate ferredoxin oxidoreductase subunit gamma
MNIRLAGFGGQGIVMAGYVLGRAAIMDGRNALQTQSYGSESRGGACKSDIVISDTEILDLAPSESDVLIAMSQPALDKYLPTLNGNGILIYENDLVRPANTMPRAFGLPATDIAHKTFGRDVVANVIVVGYLAGLVGVVSRDSLRRAISESVPSKTVEMNLNAFEEGFTRGAEQRYRLEE